MSADIERVKSELRLLIRHKLGTLSPDARKAASQAICDRVTGLPLWMSAAGVMLFASMPDEPDVTSLLEDALAAKTLVALPRYAAIDQKYVAARVSNSSTDLAPGRFKVFEPGPTCPVVPLNRLDLMLVPGVAFDARGRRLGRGRGYYDRLLADFGGISCGIAFDEQIIECVPELPHDIRLNCILTPTRCIQTTRGL